MQPSPLTNYLTQVRELAWFDFRLRYIRSRLGLLWAVLVPFMTFGVLYVVFTFFAPKDTGPAFIFNLLLGVILWSFFLDATTSSIENIIGKRALVRNIVFPISTLTLAACIDSFIVLSINLSVYVIALAANGLLHINWELLAFIPLILGFLFTTAGISLMLSTINVAYRDIQHIWMVALQLGFFLSPIIYPLSSVPQPIRPWYLLNPLATAVPQARNIFVTHTADISTISLFLLAGIAVYLIGYKLTEFLNPRLREEI